MNKEFLVTTIDKVRTVYVVRADNEEEARSKIEAPEDGNGIQIESQEFYDLDSIEEIKENV